MPVSNALLEAIGVTVELTGTQMSKGAARVMAEDLARYPEFQVLGALTRCRRELKGRLTIADVLTRLEDGRPGAEEAWALIPKDEDGSVVWTDEMASAFGVACPLLAQGDRIAARMAFLESYRNLIVAARDQGKPVKWTPSLGHNSLGRESVLLEAVMRGRLTREHVAGLLPHREDALPAVVAMLPDMTAKGRSLKDALTEARKQAYIRERAKPKSFADARAKEDEWAG